MSDATTPPPGGPDGLLLSRDLLFVSKITGTARMLGHRVLTAGDPSQAATLVEQWRPRAVFVDLAAGDLASPATLIALQRVAGPATPFVAFGSHVDTAALDAARASGCALVLPRSKFAAQLPDLIQRFLGEEERQEED